jgi:hypothetical protein
MTPPTTNFGTVTIGSSATASITVTTTGGAGNQTNATPYFNGTNAADFTNVTPVPPARIALVQHTSIDVPRPPRDLENANPPSTSRLPLGSRVPSHHPRAPQM